MLAIAFAARKKPTKNPLEHPAKKLAAPVPAATSRVRRGGGS
jgi:hypothetical protein